MYLGRAAEAVTLLKELEIQKPGEYATAANLGTAYELAGDNREALRWIEESIKRNDDAHFGTEWLHVKILEAKLKQETEPDYSTRHSVLDIDYAQLGERAAELKIGGETRRTKDVIFAIEHQLVERFKFVKSPDPSVASLLFDLAAIEAGAFTLEAATGFLRMASDFGYPAERAHPLMKQFERTIWLRKARFYGWCMTLVLLAISGLIYSAKKGWFVLSAKTLPAKTPSRRSNPRIPPG